MKLLFIYALRQWRQRPEPWLWCSFTLAVTLSITAIAWQNAQEQNLQHLQSNFAFHVYETAERIKNRMAAYEQVLRGTRGLFAASVSVERDEFKTYVETLQLEQHYPGIQGVGISIIIPKTQKNQHIKRMQQQGFLNYHLRPEGERELYSAIIQLEPFTGRNLRAFGYDMYAEAVRRQAMQTARDSGHAALSGKVTLVQETNQDIQAGFLMYLPVYKNNLAHDTLEQRHAAIVAWVYEPFRMNDFMRGLNTTLVTDISIEIYDDAAMSEASKLFDSDNTAGNCAEQQPRPRLSTVRTIALPNHYWTLRACTTPLLETQGNSDKALIIAILGSFLSVLMAFIVWQLATGQKRALTLAQAMNREARESETRFQLMADSAPVLIWVAGADKCCHWFNKTALDFTGHTLEHEISDGWLSGIHPDDKEQGTARHPEHFDRHEAFTREYRLRRYDGEYRWMLDTGVPRFDADGVFTGYVGSCIDITERKQTEAALLRSNADLEQFAYSISHDMRQPLRSITNHLQIIGRSLQDQLQGDAVESFAFVLEGAKRLDAMILSLLDYSRVGRKTNDKVWQASRTIVHDSLSLLTTAITEAEAIIHITGDWPRVFVSHDELIRLFLNLVSNALKYRESSARPIITIDSRVNSNTWQVSVRDNGIGINPHYINRLFQFFSRLQSRTRFDGTGMGLALCRRIVEHHQGKIWVESAGEGQGCCFIFNLPLAVEAV